MFDNPYFGKISCGEHSLIIKPDGSLYGWGNNDYGQLGLGYVGDVYKIKNSIKRIGYYKEWKFISCGDTVSLGIKNDGTLWGTGYNSYGELGLGHINQVNTFTQVGIDTDWKYVNTSGNVSVAIKTDGTLWICGQNPIGFEVFQGQPSKILQFTQFGTDTDWKYAVCTTGTVIALKTDGTVWGWGFNQYNQLGDILPVGTFNAYTPTKLSESTNWVSMTTVYSDNTCLINDLGELYVCGRNESYSLSNIDGNVLTLTKIMDSVSLVQADYDSLFIIKTDGTLWCRGSSTAGQLGLGNTSTVSEFTQVGVDTDWQYIISEWQFTVAIKNNDSIFVCGNKNHLPIEIGQYEYELSTLTSITLPDTINYKQKSGKFVIGAGGTGTNLNFTLESQTYILTINSTPLDALVEVYYNRKWNTGKTHILMDGEYPYRVSKYGYITQESSIIIEGSDNSIDISLIESNNYTVTISTEPSNAIVEVYYNGEWHEGNIHQLPNGEYSYKTYRSGYIGSIDGSSKFTVASEDKTFSVTLTEYFTTYDLTINATPPDSIIQVFYNDRWFDGSVHAPLHPGDYPYHVLRDDYITKEGSVTLDSDKIIDVTLDPITYTLTINPTPSDATVQVYYNDQWNTGTTHIVPNGDYQYKVVKDGYTPQESTVTVFRADNSIDIVLELVPIIEYNLTITPIPEDALVEVYYNDTWNIGTAHTLQNGEYQYRISKNGYVTEEALVIISDDDKTINITLNLIKYTLNINPTPIDALVEVYYNDQWNTGTTHMIINGTYNYRVSKEKYTTEEGTITMSDSDNSIEVILTQSEFTLTINPTPSDATVQVYYNDQWNTGTTHIVPNGDYNYKVSKTGYITQESSVNIQDVDQNIDVELEIVKYTVTINTTEVDPQRTINITEKYDEANTILSLTSDTESVYTCQLPNGDYVALVENSVDSSKNQKYAFKVSSNTEFDLKRIPLSFNLLDSQYEYDYINIDQEGEGYTRMTINSEVTSVNLNKNTNYRYSVMKNNSTIKSGSITMGIGTPSGSTSASEVVVNLISTEGQWWDISTSVSNLHDMSAVKVKYEISGITTINKEINLPTDYTGILTNIPKNVNITVSFYDINDNLLYSNNAVSTDELPYNREDWDMSIFNLVFAVTNFTDYNKFVVEKQNGENYDIILQNNTKQSKYNVVVGTGYYVYTLYKDSTSLKTGSKQLYTYTTIPVQTIL